MAEGKKSFVLYCDLKHTVELLDDNMAGRLFKLLLRYVNDENPEPDDLLLKVAFEPIKRQLKRDLADWRETKDERRNSGVLGNLKRWNTDVYEKVVSGEITLQEAEVIANGRTAIANVAQRQKLSHSDRKRRTATKIIANGRTAIANVANVAVNVNVNDNVSVNDNVNIIFNWDFEKQNFFNDFKWKEKFCIDKKIEMPALEKLMTGFIADLELKEDYRDVKELRRYFVNYFNKMRKDATSRLLKTNSGCSPGSAEGGTSGRRIDAAKDW